jgi:uncharacterized protein with FMN-binding domain
MKKISIVLLLFLLQPLSAIASSSVVGFSSIGIVFSIPNIYYQKQIAEKTAFTVEFAVGNETYFDGYSFATSYQKYWKQYGLGGYTRFGVAMLSMSDTSSTSSSVIPVLIIGSEKKITDKLHFSLEGGTGSTAGFSIFAVNVNYLF